MAHDSKVMGDILYNDRLGFIFKLHDDREIPEEMVNHWNSDVKSYCRPDRQEEKMYWLVQVFIKRLGIRGQYIIGQPHEIRRLKNAFASSDPGAEFNRII